MAVVKQFICKEVGCEYTCKSIYEMEAHVENTGHSMEVEYRKEV